MEKKTFTEDWFIATSPNGLYYTKDTIWIPEGDLDIISETPHIEYSIKFESVNEIHEYAEDVKRNDDPYYEGDFIPSKIKKIKVTKIYEEVEEVFVF